MVSSALSIIYLFFLLFVGGQDGNIILWPVSLCADHFIGGVRVM